ncbi:MAG TPA: hypothetical protein DDZ81_04390 [Acetobacteraceae bacterium]|jgi:hypothetical protein|nr:hypothetical protein [Acetobacteraceae bacterium]
MDRSNSNLHSLQAQNPASPPVIDDAALEAALSADRFGRYLAWAGGDRARALDLYALNIRLSEALYPSLQMLEVVLRNRIHAIMSEAIAPDWLLRDDTLLVPHQAMQIATAVSELGRDTKAPTPSGIVAALTFSFWTTMLGPSYENLWQTHLHRIGRRRDGKGLRRKDFSAPLTPIRILRNRIAHHEPVLSWNLPGHHQAMHRLTGWLSPGAATWCFTFDRFVAVCPSTRIGLLNN